MCCQVLLDLIFGATSCQCPFVTETREQTQQQTQTHSHTHTDIYTHIYTYTYIHMNTHCWFKHTYVHTYMHHATQAHLDRLIDVYIASQNMKICVHRRGYSWYVWHALTCTHIDLSIFPYVYSLRSATRSWKYDNKCQFRWQKYLFTQIDTDRFVYLHVSIPPAKPVLSEQCHAPVLQQQPAHRAVMHVTEVTYGLFHRQTHHFRGLGAARDAENVQYGTVCGTLSSHWSLCFYLQIYVCCWEPYVNNGSCEGAVLRKSSS